MQKAVQEFTSECARSRIYVDGDMPIGAFHDFLMTIKCLMVNRMVQAQKEQEEQAKKALQPELQDPCPEVSCAPECPPCPPCADIEPAPLEA